jgi:O-antigen biosynthesis protein WbqP
VKRSFDIFLVLLLAPLAIVIVVFCAVLIRLSSPGPAILRQERVGKGAASFICLKLRTMQLGTANIASHLNSTAVITPLGRVLRRLKLDEVPQFWNILKGDMSFVGPRPCLPSQCELIEARRMLGVYALRPGITGVSQVAGVDMSEPVQLAELDATYLENQNLIFDVKLIVATGLGAGRGDRVAV